MTSFHLPSPITLLSSALPFFSLPTVFSTKYFCTLHRLLACLQAVMNSESFVACQTCRRPIGIPSLRSQLPSSSLPFPTFLMTINHNECYTIYYTSLYNITYFIMGFLNFSVVLGWYLFYLYTPIFLKLKIKIAIQFSIHHIGVIN